MDISHDNPFAALTLIAAPAVLTNACSVLALGTSNRFARAVDRQRYLTAQIEADDGKMDDPTAALKMRQLRRAELRAQLVIRALASFYTALGSFAADALISLLGAITGGQVPWVTVGIRGVAMVIGFVGVGGLVFGCSLLIRETRLTLAGLREEADFTRERFQLRRPDAAKGDGQAARGG